MPGCTDPKIGSLLFAYELNALNDEEWEQFSAHLLNCDFCFSEVKNMAHYMKLVRERDSIKNLAKSAVGSELTTHLDSWRRKIWAFLWPRAPLPFKPAIAYFLILILAWPAYIGFQGSRNPIIQDPQTVYITTWQLGQEKETFSKSKSDIGIIYFVIDRFDPQKDYSIAVESAQGRVIYNDYSAQGYDENGRGNISLYLTQLQPGTYTLVISNLQEEFPPYRQDFEILD